ncbi:MAG: nucleotidyltransferase domain-containing protein [Gemmatimonadota bacterium]
MVSEAYRRSPVRGQLDTGVLAEIVRRVVDVARPDRIILFGSAARGEMGPDSDVDLLVIKSGVEHRRKLSQEIHMNLFGVGAAVDVVVAARADLALARRAGDVTEEDCRQAIELSELVVRWAHDVIGK